MSLHLFAGLRARDFQASLPWYERLLGEPTRFPLETEAVWTLADDGSVYVVEHPAAPGNGVLLIFVDDLDAQVAAIAGARARARRATHALERCAQGDLPRPGRERADLRRRARERFGLAP